MIVKNEIKSEVIGYIDQLNEKVKQVPHFENDEKRLQKFRDKYIYKDIGFNELKSDVDQINSIKDQLNFWIKFWNV